MDTKSKIFKSLKLGLWGMVVFFLFAEAAYQFKFYVVDQYKMKRAVERFNNSWIDLAKVGGVTAQETYEMFSDALRVGDIEKAVGYCYPSHQDSCWRQLNDKKDNEELDTYVKNLPHWNELKVFKEDVEKWEGWREKVTAKKTHYSDKEEKVKVHVGGGEYIETVLPAGEYTDFSIALVKNSYDVWQIESNL